ncbi:hypothetical protein HMPREF1430_00003 [Helicobacter pylori GAM96Ai]|nr:hypothetical protein HMPREF1430_00003 [Helicobacter pylori GAM96Ai]
MSYRLRAVARDYPSSLLLNFKNAFKRFLIKPPFLKRVFNTQTHN